MELEMILSPSRMFGHVVLNPIPVLLGIELCTVTIATTGETVLAVQVATASGLDVDSLGHQSFSVMKRSNPKLSIFEDWMFIAL